MGHRLDRRSPSNQIDHFFLADRRHIGTLGHAFIAQHLIETLNRAFGGNRAVERPGSPPLRLDAGAPPSQVKVAGDVEEEEEF